MLLCFLIAFRYIFQIRIHFGSTHDVTKSLEAFRVQLCPNGLIRFLTFDILCL